MLLFLFAIGDVVRLVLIASLLAYLLDPIVKRLESRGLSRTLSTSSVFVALVLLISGVLFYLVPIIGAQFVAIQANLDVVSTQAAIERIERLIESKLAVMGVGDLRLMENVREFVTEQARQIVGYVPSVLQVLGDVVIVPFIVFFLLKDSRVLKRSFIHWVPNRYFEFTLNVLHKTDVQLGNYLRGQVLDALIIGVLSIFALWVLEVEYYVVIGMLAGIANLIPYVGPVTGALLAVIVSSMTGGTLFDAFAIVAAFTGIQLIDNAIVSPLVIAKNVKLHPLLILLVVIIGGKFFGMLGLLLAVPVAAVIKVILVETVRNLRRYRFA